jgi:UDP-glucose 4-epimerase
MGMTKALQERILLSGGLTCPTTRFICVRYGNVLASRGSVIPLFLSQIKSGGPVTVTTEAMTRFLLTLDDAVDLIFAAVAGAHNGETYIPRVRAARVVDIAEVLINGRGIPIVVTGIRPGEKVHEIMISEEEIHRTRARGKHYVISNILPELAVEAGEARPLDAPYSSGDHLMSVDDLREYLRVNSLLSEASQEPVEILR